MNGKNKFKQFAKSAVMLFKAEKKIPIPTPVNSTAVLANKVALITGGSSGIGFSIAKAFLDSGCKVIIAGTKEEKLKNACEKLESGIQYIVLDVRNISVLPDLIRQAAQLFEENRIDILVNSAGIHNTKNFVDMDEEEYDRIMDTNVKGTFFLCQAMGNYMIESGIKGHILMLSSSAALRPANSPYQMSKWAIRGFTLGLAATLQPYGIVVNAIAPGQSATPMLGKKETDNIDHGRAISGRYIMPSEIAPLAVFMVSDLGNMIVGDTVYLTGGSGVITYSG